MIEQNNETSSEKRRFGCLHVAGIAVFVIIITALLTTWWVRRNIYASQFTPTTLSNVEQKTLDSKLKKIELSAEHSRPQSETASSRPDAAVQPAPSGEEDDDELKREISISEKELNALFAKDPEFAKHVKIDLAEDSVSVRLLLPVDEDIPVVGGKTIRLRVAVTIRYENAQPFVAMRSVSIGGIPMPGAWWGEIKGKNLIEEFDSEGGFWDQFSKGVADMRVRDGELWVKLKE